MIYIKVVEYKGKSGGFATRATDRWDVSLVNEEKGKEICLNSFMTGGHGYSSLHYALNHARPYSELLNIPIKQFKRKVLTRNEDIEV